MCHHGFSYAAGRFMKCHGFGPHQLNNGIYIPVTPILLTCTWERLINTLNLPMDVWVIILKALDWDFMGYDLPTGKRIFLIPKRTNACTLTEAGDLPQSYPTLLDRVKSWWLNSTSQYDGQLLMKVITTRLISSKKIGTAIDPKFKEHQTTIDKVFQTDFKAFIT
jgi:penicillin-binding protein 2